MKDEVLKGYAQTRNAGDGVSVRCALWQRRCWSRVFALWQVLTQPDAARRRSSADNPNRAAFFFGEPLRSLKVIWDWFASAARSTRIWGSRCSRPRSRSSIGTRARARASGLWLALSPTASALLDPYIKAMNAMPRVILAPIFAVWFGLGIWSKVALGVTLVFFIVFFNVYQGVKEVSPVVLANARMLGASRAPAAALRLSAVGDVVGVLEPAHLGRAWRSSARWSASISAPRGASAI